jgi:hypothetical protein
LKYTLHGYQVQVAVVRKEEPDCGGLLDGWDKEVRS